MLRALSEECTITFSLAVVLSAPCATLFPYTTLFRSRQNVGYSNFSQPQSHLSFCVLLQYLVERRRVVTQLEAERKKRDEDRKSGSAGMPRPISYAVFCLKKKKNKRKKTRIKINTNVL